MSPTATSRLPLERPTLRLDRTAMKALDDIRTHLRTTGVRGTMSDATRFALIETARRLQRVRSQAAVA